MEGKGGSGKDGGSGKSPRRMMGVWLKSPMGGPAVRVEVPVGGRVGHLKRVMYRHFPKHGVVATMGGRELRDNYELLERAGVRPDSTVAVALRLNAGPHGNLGDQPSLSSEGSEREQAEALPAMPDGPVLIIPASVFFGLPSPLQPAPPSSAPTPPKPSASAEEKQRIERAEKKRKETLARLAAVRSSSRSKVVKERKRSAVSLSTASDTSLRSEVASERSSPEAPAAEPRRSVSAPSSPVHREQDGTACAKCTRRLNPLQAVACRCRRFFCKRHRQPSDHGCTQRPPK